MKNYFYYLYQDDGFTDRIVKALILKKIQQKNKVIVVSDEFPWGFSPTNPPDYTVLGSGDDLCSISKLEGVELIFTDSIEDESIQNILDSDACIVWNCAFSRFYVQSSPATKAKILIRASKQIDIFSDPYGYIDDREQSPMEQFLIDAGPVFDGIFCASYYRMSATNFQLKSFKNSLVFKTGTLTDPQKISSDYKDKNSRKVTFYVVNKFINEFTFNHGIRDDYERLAQLFSIK